MKIFSQARSRLRHWFSRRSTLAHLAPETIRKERIRIEQTELKLTREIEEVESQKQEFFRKGVEGGSDRQRRQIARKIKQLDAVVQAKDKQLMLISKNLQVLTSISQLKENERLLADLGMDGVVSKMDMGEVQQYIERATVEGQFQLERFTQLLRSVHEAEDLYAVDECDANTQAIMEAMDLAARTNSVDAIKDGMEQVGRVLRKRTEETTA